jgi:hypothetical protein
MYVCTVVLPALNWLIRIDVGYVEGGSFARYARVDENGAGDSYTCPIGPDTNDIGLSTVAVVDLIKDLNWNEIDGEIRVVHIGSIGPEQFSGILEQVYPAYALRQMTTSDTAH